MTTFSESKAGKLKRKPVLRIFNIVGMVHWKLNEYGEAEQYLRLLHPLSWLWLVVTTVIALPFYGIFETYKDLCYCLKHETVWF